MNKAKNFISKLVYNKFFWQFFLALFMLGTGIFFIRDQHIELLNIGKQLQNSAPLFVGIGILLAVVYLLAQGQMYIHSFKALGISISLKKATVLFLKRNFISIFLPAGGFSSLAFFTSELENESASKSKIHLASTLFGFCGILSVVLVAIPVLGVALLFTRLGTTELISFVFLILLSIVIGFSIYSISKKGKVYRWLTKIRPSISTILDDMMEQKINRNQFWLTLFVSLIIEVIGIVHLYICMLALGYEPSVPAAILGYIVMVILLIASPFLRGLGAIEVSLTFLLQQFGFPLLAAAAITLLFRFFEFWLPLLAGIAVFIVKKDNLLLRVLPAFIILILGIVNIISSLTPAIPARLHMMKDILPNSIIVTSNALMFVFGLILVLLSIFLLQGSKRAWYLALFITGSSVVGHLVKAADYEEALLAFVSFSSLIYTRSNYKVKPHPRFVSFNIWLPVYASLLLLIYSTLGFYFIDKRHFGIDFNFFGSLKAVLKVIFFVDDKALDPRTRFGENFEYSILILSASVILFLIYCLLKPYFQKPYNTEHDFTDGDRLISQFGSSALDYFKTYPDKFLFFNAARTAFISFKMTRQFIIVLEDPVSATEAEKRDLIKTFEERCADNGFITAYYRVPETSLPFYNSIGKKHIPIGEEAVLDLRKFALEGGKMKTTRSAVNRLTSEGFVFKVYEGPISEGLLQKLHIVSNNWLNDLNQQEVAFTQGVFDKTILKHQTILTIEDAEERVYAFLNLVPDYAPGEATYDLIRKDTEAPNGVLDMLLAKTFLYLKEKNYSYVNMGLAPLSGIEGKDFKLRTIKYAYENISAFAQFKGLRRYKEKFNPEWNKKYLIYSHNYQLLQMPNALKRVSKGI